MLYCLGNGKKFFFHGYGMFKMQQKVDRRGLKEFNNICPLPNLPEFSLLATGTFKF